MPRSAPAPGEVVCRQAGSTPVPQGQELEPRACGLGPPAHITPRCVCSSSPHFIRRMYHQAEKAGGGYSKALHACPSATMDPRTTDRLPPVKREDLPASERTAFDGLAALAGDLFGPPNESPFFYKRHDDGAFVGPFPFFLEAPEAGEHAMALYGKLAGIPGLPADAKEVAILTVGAHFQAAYELYAHVNVATKKVAMPADQVNAIAQGKRPDGMNEGCAVAYDAARHLCATPGPLPRALWENCLSAFGKTGTVALVHYIGAYSYTCIILNGMDCPVPADG